MSSITNPCFRTDCRTLRKAIRDTDEPTCDQLFNLKRCLEEKLGRLQNSELLKNKNPKQARIDKTEGKINKLMEKMLEMNCPN